MVFEVPLKIINFTNMTKRILHGRAEIQNFSSSVEKYFTSVRSKRVKYFSTQEEKFRISKWPYSILFII